MAFRVVVVVVGGDAGRGRARQAQHPPTRRKGCRRSHCFSSRLIFDVMNFCAVWEQEAWIRISFCQWLNFFRLQRHAKSKNRRLRAGWKLLTCCLHRRRYCCCRRRVRSVISCGTCWPTRFIFFASLLFQLIKGSIVVVWKETDLPAIDASTNFMNILASLLPRGSSTALTVLDTIASLASNHHRMRFLSHHQQGCIHFIRVSF